MLRSNVRHVLPLFALALAACAGTAAAPPGAPMPYDEHGVLELQEGWWRAFTVGDTAYLRAHTAPSFSLTLSSGRTLDRAGMLAQATTHTSGASIGLAWADGAVHPLPGASAVARVRVTERVGSTSTSYRYLTVLERGADGGLRVSAAQSTREAAFSPRVSAGEAGPLSDYTGEYRTPRGFALRVVDRDSALGLVEPSGAELPLEPIGPGLFEVGRLSPANGIVRFVFIRDATGRVTGMTRLVPGEVTTFPRIH